MGGCATPHACQLMCSVILPQGMFVWAFNGVGLGLLLPNAQVRASGRSVCRRGGRVRRWRHKGCGLWTARSLVLKQAPRPYFLAVPYSRLL